MPTSPHLRRKLQDALGADAADDLVTRVDQFDAIRGDIGELRHETQLGRARLDETRASLEGKINETRGSLEGKINETRASLEGKINETRANLEGKINETRASLEGFRASLEEKINATRASLEGMIAANHASLQAVLEKGLREQMRFFFLAWSVLLAAIIGLYAR